VPDLANQIASCWLLFRHALAPAFLKKNFVM
jgi:hypothetical protein